MAVCFTVHSLVALCNTRPLDFCSNLPHYGEIAEIYSLEATYPGTDRKNSLSRLMLNEFINGYLKFQKNVSIMVNNKSHSNSFNILREDSSRKLMKNAMQRSSKRGPLLVTKPMICTLKVPRSIHFLVLRVPNGLGLSKDLVKATVT